MKLVKAKLAERIQRTSSVESFRFIPAEKIEFIPGQFLQVIFDETNRDNRELNKYLSFSSSPTKEYIEATKRLSDSQFSQKLKNLKIGDEVLLKAPLGNCVYKDEYKKIGFLIGGIGITPIISILEYIIDKKLNTDVLLLYSNKTEQDIAFRKELDHWKSINSNIKVFYTLTERKPTDKNCISGRINRDLFIEKVKDVDERIFFIFGPPKMVEAMKDLCLEIGCDKENIKSESFIGY
ncbi:MAG: FAD-dependent oxidoreductase [Candidatus Omnitrophica bacterium]|nr:FAD-dependent oxidoreductase [Candidatus Omnitrophota bacterium]